MNQTNMNEETKSLWRRSWKGPWGIVLWVITLTVLLSIIAVVSLIFIGEITLGSAIAIPLVIGLAVFCVTFGCVLVVRSVRWCCCWRNLRRALFVLVCLATLATLFYAEENWRGQQAWKKFKTEWERRGEHFRLTSLAPPPVPDDQNFAMTPIWVEAICATMGAERGRVWYGDRVTALGHTNFINRLAMTTDLYVEGLKFSAQVGDWQRAEKTDLGMWQDYYRRLAVLTNFFPVPPEPRTPAADVLLALSRYEATIEELRKSGELPFARFPLGYNDDDPAGILLPHLPSIRYPARALQLRAIAELQSGQTEKALTDVELMLRLTEAAHNEPILISQLVRVAMVRLLLQPVWEGLADHKWTDAQLAALEAEFGQLDFLADYQFAIRGELAAQVGVIDYVRRLRDLTVLNVQLTAIGIDSGRGSASHSESSVVSAARRFEEAFEEAFDKALTTVLPRFMPGGWFEQNKLTLARMHMDLVWPPANLETRTVSVTAVRRATDACERIRPGPFSLFARLSLPALSGCTWKFAYGKWSVDAARIACALERYRLAHGNFPETLMALTPRFIESIPTDVIDGKPLRYRQKPDGGYLLYSVGWNQTDDGGEIAWRNGESPRVDVYKGDWVWQMPDK